jgi:hypothetical protein
MKWLTRMSRYSAIAGVAFIPVAAQTAQPVDEANVALIVFLIAIGLTLLVAGGLAVLMWLLSLRSPHAAIGAQSKTAPKQYEELPPGVHMPSPSIQPLILAAGMTIMVFGMVFRGFALTLGEGFSIPIIMTLGIIIVVAGFIGWIREGRKEAQSH